MTGLEEQLPAACTLGSGPGRDQLARWQAMDASHLIDRSRAPAELVVRYRVDAHSRRELRELVDVERDCCAFLRWDVTDGTDTLRVSVRGTPSELDTLGLT